MNVYIFMCKITAGFNYRIISLSIFRNKQYLYFLLCHTVRLAIDIYLYAYRSLNRGLTGEWKLTKKVT